MWTAGARKVDNGYEAITLPPVVIFKNLTKAPKGIFPKGMVIEGMVTVQNYGKKKAAMFFPVGQISFNYGFCQITIERCS